MRDDSDDPIVVTLNAHWTARWRAGGASRLAAEQWVRAWARNASKSFQGTIVSVRASDGEELARERYAFPHERSR